MPLLNCKASVGYQFKERPCLLFFFKPHVRFTQHDTVIPVYSSKQSLEPPLRTSLQTPYYPIRTHQSITSNDPAPQLYVKYLPARPASSTSSTCTHPSNHPCIHTGCQANVSNLYANPPGPVLVRSSTRISFRQFIAQTQESACHVLFLGP